MKKSHTKNELERKKCANFLIIVDARIFGGVEFQAFFLHQTRSTTLLSCHCMRQLEHEKYFIEFLLLVVRYRNTAKINELSASLTVTKKIEEGKQFFAVFVSCVCASLSTLGVNNSATSTRVLMGHASFTFPPRTLESVALFFFEENALRAARSHGG